MLRRFLILLSIVAMFGGLLSGCGPTPGTGEKGGLNLAASFAVSKGVLSGIQVSNVEAVFTKAGSTAVKINATPVSGQATLTASNLEAGTWAIDIKAYYADNGTQYVAFGGSDSATVQANTTTSKSMTLAPQAGGAAISLSVPTGTGATSGTVSLIDPSDSAGTKSQSFDPGAGTVSATFTGLKATTMTVRVVLKNASGTTVGSAEAPIDIWPGQSKPYSVKLTTTGTTGTLVVTVQMEREPLAPKGLTWATASGKVKVSWQANIEADLAGYAVYRADGTGTDKRLLTDTLITTAEYADPGSSATGTYTYWVQAYNKKGLSSPFSTALSVDGTTPPPSSGKIYALLVGVGDYPGSTSDLTGPPLDVAAMRSSLTAGNTAIEVTALTNAQATKAGIKAAVDAIKAKATVSDSVLFYYTGHGIDGTGTNYEDEAICPYDVITSTGSLVYANLITDNEFQTWFSTAPTQNVVFVFDSCYSGGMVKGLFNGKEVSRRLVPLTTFGKDLNVATYTVMMASDKREYSYDTSTGGVYTKFFVQGLNTRTADSNSDKSIMPEELHNWLKPQVASATGNQQNPTFYKGTSAAVISLYKY